jgi:hypothetical protein
VRILDHALEPMKRQMTPASRDRLHKSLSILFGIEAYAILKDMWGMGEREIEKTVLWMADALIDASIREAAKK